MEIHINARSPTFCCPLHLFSLLSIVYLVDCELARSPIRIRDENQTKNRAIDDDNDDTDEADYDVYVSRLITRDMTPQTGVAIDVGIQKTKTTNSTRTQFI